MRVVYEAANVIDAHLVRQALEHAGLPAWVRGEALTGGMEALQLGEPLQALDDEDDLPGTVPA